MDLSKDRIIALGKDQIAKRGGDKKKEESFARRMLHKFGEGKSFLVSHTPTKCVVCGKPLNINNGNQVVQYCSKECRKIRHNRKRG
jgi:hypothetical protein